VTIADRTWDYLPAEIHSRVMAATAHARIRRIEHRDESDPAMSQGVWTVNAVAGDRFVHQVLGLRDNGSVFEETQTFLVADVVDVSVDGDRTTVAVSGPSGVESIRVPHLIGAALKQRSQDTTVAKGVR
jgi:hypothetical protein